MTRTYENEVIKTVLSGNTRAFETLVNTYSKTVYNLALRMTGSPEDAADMTQETFIKAFKSLNTFRGDSKFSVWLYRIASNVCLDFLRSKSKKQEVSLTAEEEDEELDIPDLSSLPEEKLMRSLTKDAVRRGLEALPEEYRSILILREINGLSYGEIGEVLSLEEGTVKSRIFRARKKLCAFLLKDGNIPDSLASNETEGGAEA